MSGDKVFIGNLDRLVELHKPVVTTGYDGEAVTTYQLHRKVWARKSDFGGSERMEGEQLVSDQRTKWMVRFDYEINTSWQLHHDKGVGIDIYEITSVNEAGGRRRFLELVTFELDND